MSLSIPRLRTASARAVIASTLLMSSWLHSSARLCSASFWMPATVMPTPVKSLPSNARRPSHADRASTATSIAASLLPVGEKVVPQPIDAGELDPRRFLRQAHIDLLGDFFTQGAELVQLLRRSQLRLSDRHGDGGHDLSHQGLSRHRIAHHRLRPLLCLKELIRLAGDEVRPEGGVRRASLVLGGTARAQITSFLGELLVDRCRPIESSDHLSPRFGNDLKGGMHKGRHRVTTRQSAQPP